MDVTTRVARCEGGLGAVAYVEHGAMSAALDVHAVRVALYDAMKALGNGDGSRATDRVAEAFARLAIFHRGY